MVANKEIADDWEWFRSLKKPLDDTDEIMVRRGDEMYWLSYEDLATSVLDTRPSAIGDWGFWSDSQHTDGSPQVISAGTRTLFTVDTLGATTETSYLADADSGIFSGNAINPVSVGDAFNLRLGLFVVPQQVSQGEYVEVELDIGSGSEINILFDRIDLSKGVGVVHGKALNFSMINGDVGIIDCSGEGPIRLAETATAYDILVVNETEVLTTLLRVDKSITTDASLKRDAILKIVDER